MSNFESKTDILECTATVVAAYVARHDVNMQDLPDLIRTTHEGFCRLAQSSVIKASRAPAVPIEESITKDGSAIICLEDGKHLSMLKRHLRTSYNMTPEEYRERWGLPHDYPMVAPRYSERRGALARTYGLGRSRSKKKAAAA